MRIHATAALYTVSAIAFVVAATDWAAGELTQCGIAGAISASTFIAADLIRYVRRRQRAERDREQASWARRIAETAGAWWDGTNPAWHYPRWEISGPGSWQLPEHVRPPTDAEIAAQVADIIATKARCDRPDITRKYCRAMWPDEAGAPE